MNKTHRIWEAAKASAEANPGKPALVICVEGTFALTWTPRQDDLKGIDVSSRSATPLPALPVDGTREHE